MFSTGSGSPQTVDIADVTTNKFYEISASKDGEKHKVNDVTESYITGIKELTAPNSEPTTLKVYTLDGRLLRTAKNGSDALNGLNKGVYIVNGKKVIVR